MAYCVKCGSEVGEGRFCQSCGHPRDAPEDPEAARVRAQAMSDEVPVVPPPEDKKKQDAKNTAIGCLTVIVLVVVVAGILVLMGGDDEPPASSPDSAVAVATPLQDTESLGITADQLRVRWNEAAEETHPEYQANSFNVTPGEVQDVFQHKLNEKLFLQGTINKRDDTIRDATILGGLGDQSEALDMIASWGILIAALNPELAPTQRGDILKRLRVIDNDDLSGLNEETTEGSIKYSVQVMEDIAMVMFAATEAR